MRTTGRDIGFPAPGTPSAFQPEPPVCLRSPSAPPFDDASSSRELSAFSRVLRPATCPSCPTSLATDPSAEERLPWGPRPSSRHQPAASTTPRGSQPHGQVPPSTFFTSSTACSATSLCGLVSSRCHVQGLPFRGLSLSVEPYGVSPAASCPPGVGRACLRFHPLQQTRPRLQGLAPRAECGAGRGGLDPVRSAPLLGFCSSGSSLRATWRCLHIPSAHDLRCEEPLAAGLRRFAAARIGLPGIRLPTRPSFPA
jgi:hypothetical protein